MDFTQAIYEPTEEEKRKDFVGLGRMLMVLAEGGLMEGGEDLGDDGSFLGLVYMLQREDCTIQQVKAHPFYN